MLAVIALSFLASAGAQTDLSPPGRPLVLAAAAIVWAVAITGKVTEAYAGAAEPVAGLGSLAMQVCAIALGHAHAPRP